MENRRQRVIVIPDSFKGSMSAGEVADIIGEAAERLCGCETVRLPIADGGEGSVSCILKALGGRRVYETVRSPEQKPIRAYYGITPDHTAVIEIAESSGITKQTSFQAGEATTYGFGELIRSAFDEGCRNFLLCLGGSATTDCGCGMAAALGATFRDHNGERMLPTGKSLSEVAEIDLSELDPRVRESRFTVMSDVENPLFGEQGAAYVFAPQKGALPGELPVLDAGLRHIAAKIEAVTKIACDTVRGAGAAGGAGYGCAAFLGAKIESGIEAMLTICRFEEMAEDCDLIVTGEGKLDEQSLMGKVLSGIRRHSGGKPIVSFCGLCELSEQERGTAGIEIVEIGRGVAVEESIKNGALYLKRAAEGYFAG